MCTRFQRSCAVIRLGLVFLLLRFSRRFFVVIRTCYHGFRRKEWNNKLGLIILYALLLRHRPPVINEHINRNPFSTRFTFSPAFRVESAENLLRGKYFRIFLAYNIRVRSVLYASPFDFFSFRCQLYTCVCIQARSIHRLILLLVEHNNYRQHLAGQLIDNIILSE